MTATRPQPRKGVLEIDAYVPGKSTAPGVAPASAMSIAPMRPAAPTMPILMSAMARREPLPVIAG